MKLKRLTSILLALVLTLGTAIPVLAQDANVETNSAAQPQVWAADAVGTVRPRVIVTQDAECDDQDSLIRFLLFSNHFDVEGIIQSSSTHHWMGNEEKGIESKRWPGTDWMYEFLDAYEACYENLIVHEDGFPTPEYLRSITKIGNIESYNDMEEETEGSELIKSVLLDDDDRTVYLQAWGGPCTIARALLSIQEEYEGTDEWDEIYEKVSQKAIIEAISWQDQTYTNYIAVEWPEIVALLHGNWTTFAYAWESSIPAESAVRFYGDWMYENIKYGHGPLMERYLLWADGTYYEGETWDNQFGVNEDLLTSWWGAGSMGVKRQYDYISEGDSPSFLNHIDVGLRSMEDYSYGGWGGRFTGKTGNVYNENIKDTNTVDGFEWVNALGRSITPNAVARWMYDGQGEFAARADWLVTPSYEDANHPPVVSVAEGLDFIAKPGAPITLTGEAEDPDGDNVDLFWFYYWDAGTYGKDVPFTDDGNGTLTFTVPEDAQEGDTIHMILTGRDDGEHTVARYQRVIVTVGEVDEDATITMTTTAHNVQAGDFIPVYASFKEEQPSNTVILNFTFDSEKFAYNGYSVDGVNNVKLVDYQSGEGWAKITLMAQNYDAKDLGYLGLRAKENAPLIRERQYVNVTADYVLRDEDGNKSVADTKTKVSFTTIGDGEGGPGLPGDTNNDGVVDIMDLSNMIDWFGYTPENQADWDDWHTYFDFNNNNEIDISDIAYVARLI